MFIVNIIFGLTGVLFLFLGYLIWKHKMLQLLAGYDETKVKDKEGLAYYTGKHLVVMGAIILAISVSGIVADTSTIIPYVMIVLIISIKMAKGTKQFEKNKK